MLRSGFGLYYDLGFGGGISGAMGNFPYYSTRSSGQVPFDFRNRAFAPPAFTLLPNAETGEVTAIDPNLRPPLVYEWNTAAEEALGPT